MPWSVRRSGSFPNGARGNIPSRYHPTPLPPPTGQSCSMSPPNSTPGRNLNCVPVALISILVPFVMRSTSRRKDASCSRSPGASTSSDRMFRRRRGREDSRDRTMRRRNCVEPSSNFRVRDGDDEDATTLAEVVFVVVVMMMIISRLLGFLVLVWCFGSEFWDGGRGGEARRGEARVVGRWWSWVWWPVRRPGIVW